MRRQETKTPKTGRPRVHPLEPGSRPQIAFGTTVELVTKIRELAVRSGRTQTAQIEAILERYVLADDLITQRYGANAILITAIEDVADTARRWGEALAADQGIDQDDAEVRIYMAVIAAVRLIVAWHDLAEKGKIYNPRHVGDGALTWETLPNHAAWATYNRSASDPKRLVAFKALDAKFQKQKKGTR